MAGPVHDLAEHAGQQLAHRTGSVTQHLRCHRPAARRASPGTGGQQLGRVSPQSSGGPDDGGDLVVVDLRRPDPVEPGPAGQAGHGHPDIGRVIQQDRGGVGVLADLLPQRGHRTVQGAGGEADGDLAVVADAGRDGVPGRPLGEEHDLDGDVAALADQLLDQPGQLGHEGVVGLDLGAGALALVEEGVRLVDHHHDQRPATATGRGARRR